MVGIAAGRCYAGNASLLGCCDVVIATKNSNIGTGGPAMIEGGGLGVYRPEDIGPIEVQSANGVVDIVVDNEADAVVIEGRPVGVMVNNPNHLGGAIDADAADKAARFMQLCDAVDLPLVSFVDTPGIMVGPDVETTALVRHSSRLFLVGANIAVPTFGVVLRKAYGLGGIAMTGGSFKANLFTVSWPTGEWGTMGLEGSVHLAYRNAMADIDDPPSAARSTNTSPGPTKPVAPYASPTPSPSPSPSPTPGTGSPTSSPRYDPHRRGPTRNVSSSTPGNGQRTVPRYRRVPPE